MYQEISQLLMYGDLDEDSILAQMGEVFGKYETGEYNCLLYTSPSPRDA